jgi:predicted phosphoribosyltransferase
LDSPLDIFLVQRFFAPGYEDVPVGIIASGGVRIFNDVAVRQLGISEEVTSALARECEQNLRRRETDYRGDVKPARIEGHNVLLVADGLSVAVNVRAAVQALKARRARAISIAAPVSSLETCHELVHDVDDIICAMTPEPLYSIGAWYADFIQVSDAEARRVLKQAAVESRRSRRNEKK